MQKQKMAPNSMHIQHIGWWFPRTLLTQVVTKVLSYAFARVEGTMEASLVRPDDGHRNCPKHLEPHSSHTFEVLVHLFGFNKRKLHSRVVQ